MEDTHAGQVGSLAAIISSQPSNGPLGLQLAKLLERTLVPSSLSWTLGQRCCSAHRMRASCDADAYRHKVLHQFIGFLEQEQLASEVKTTHSVCVQTPGEAYLKVFKNYQTITTRRGGDILKPYEISRSNSVVFDDFSQTIAMNRKTTVMSSNHMMNSTNNIHGEFVFFTYFECD